MYYLERNSRLISEIKDSLQIIRGTQRGISDRVRFFSAGSYTSRELGTEVYIGLKESTAKSAAGRAEALRNRFMFEMGVMSVVAQRLPHLLPELPQFYGLLEDKNGVTIAIITVIESPR